MKAERLPGLISCSVILHYFSNRQVPIGELPVKELI